DEMLSNIAYDAMTEIFKDRLGAESLITSEMENDPIFRQLVDNIILDDMPDDEREELIVNMYKNVKSQIEQNINLTWNYSFSKLLASFMFCSIC
ncbi:hypothetical protein, partial [Mycoplasmopsis bovis]|uniref:hypothetical protein n=1 Tax=Mycoplasmopsis bovis TaxID=28903 RepID=UPI003D2B1C96